MSDTVIQEPNDEFGLLTDDNMISLANANSKLLNNFSMNWEKYEEDGESAIECECFRIEQVYKPFEWKSIRGTHRQMRVRYVAYVLDEEGEPRPLDDDFGCIEDAVFQCWVRYNYWAYKSRQCDAAYAADIQWQKDHADEIKEVVEEGKKQLGY